MFNRIVAKRDPGLLGRIEQDVLDGDKPLADALRKCVVLGGRAGSPELREWATLELRGYPDADQVPGYRRIPATIALDCISGGYEITNQRISPNQLPAFAQEQIREEFVFTSGVREMEELARQAHPDGVHSSLPSAADIARYLDAEIGDPNQTITSLYWVLSEPAITSCLDEIRTLLTELVAEMRATLPRKEATPSAAAADRAVDVVLYGARRAGVGGTPGHATGRSVGATQPMHAHVRPFWTRSRRVVACVVAGAGVLAAVVAVLAPPGWGPF